jgi:hypothetical protein
VSRTRINVAARCAIGSAGRVLLVYDAIADERVLRDWLPADNHNCHVLATSTSAIWARLGPHRVRPLDTRLYSRW